MKKLNKKERLEFERLQLEEKERQAKEWKQKLNKIIKEEVKKHYWEKDWLVMSNGKHLIEKVTAHYKFENRFGCYAIKIEYMINEIDKELVLKFMHEEIRDSIYEKLFK